MPTKDIQCSTFSAYLDGKRIDNFSIEPVELEAELPAVPPIGDLHSVPHFRCGVCRRAVVVFDDDPKPDSCRWCGRKINWNVFY